MDMVFVMENDEWETQEWMKPKCASPVACLAKTSELIRSLRDDEQGKNAGTSDAQVVAQLRKGRIVAHNLTDMSLLSSVSRIRRSFFEANVPIVVILIGPCVAPIYNIKMKPCFMMTTLIIWSQAECFPRDGEGAVLVHFPASLRARRVEKSTDVCPFVRNGSRSPQWWGAQWRRQGAVREGFVNSTEDVFAATSHGTKSENELLGDAFLLGVDVADMQRQHSKELLTTDCGSTK